MNIFNINNPLARKILNEELARIKRILTEGVQYSADEIWKLMSPEERRSVLTNNQVENQEMILNSNWDSIDANIQDTIDLSNFELAKYDQGGRTNLRAIENFIKRVPDCTSLVNKFLSKIGRNSRADLTIKQSYQLLLALHKFMDQSRPAQPEIDTDLEDRVKRAWLDRERGAGRTSGLD